MKFTISENKFKEVFKTWIKKNTDFENLFFDWGFYNCGMGTCCDENYLSLCDQSYQGDWGGVEFMVCNKQYFFTKRNREYEELPEICMDDPDEHKKEFPILIIQNEDLLETMIEFFGDDIWRPILIELINESFGTAVTEIRDFN